MVLLGMNISGMCFIIINLMYSTLLQITGFTSDGEFNFLQNKGYMYPLLVLQFCTGVCNKFSRISAQNLWSHLKVRVY